MNNRNNKGNNPNQKIIIIIVALVAGFLISGLFRSFVNDKTRQEISYNEFYQMCQNGDVASVEVGTTEINIRVKEGSKKYSPYMKYYTQLMEDPLRTQMLLKYNVTAFQEKPDTSSAIWDVLLGFVLPFAAIFFLFTILSKRMGGGGGIMGVGKTNAKLHMQMKTGVTFADVAGVEEAKESLVEIVDFLHDPGKYREIGAKLPKGALLVGPPGTGKTLLAKAVAGEAKVPFFSLTGSDFVEMFVGVGASRVRDLFKQATQAAPCIIFIDEIDAIGKSRDTRYGAGGNDEREQTLNQLLSEMDGFDPAKGIMVLGATNRPEILDPALLRAGRFDRRVVVEKPDLKGRVSILKVHARNVKLDRTVNFDEIGLATSGAAGADLANMVNEAAIMAVKNGRKAVSQKDLLAAVEVVLVGKEKKDRILSQEERRIVSYHEVGHALIAAVQKDAEPVQKITIVPRTMGVLGYVMQVPEEEKFLNTKKELEAELVTLLGGRAAEELVFDSVTTGAANDIEKATTLARNMVTRFGMSRRFGLMGLATLQDQYLTGGTVLNCGDETAAEIDHEVMEMLKTAYDEARRILSENMDALHKISAYLIEKETITGREFMELFHGVKEPAAQETPAAQEPTAPEAETAPAAAAAPEPETPAPEAQTAETAPAADDSGNADAPEQEP